VDQVSQSFDVFLLFISTMKLLNLLVHGNIMSALQFSFKLIIQIWLYLSLMSVLVCEEFHT